MVEFQSLKLSKSDHQTALHNLQTGRIFSSTKSNLHICFKPKNSTHSLLLNKYDWRKNSDQHLCGISISIFVWFPSAFSVSEVNII